MRNSPPCRRDGHGHATPRRACIRYTSSCVQDDINLVASTAFLKAKKPHVQKLYQDIISAAMKKRAPVVELLAVEGGGHLLQASRLP